ncbi:MAG: YfiR family protein, partial [Verrucomicrobiales bacterium]|nr:YfiR family protein [Verrucomicrobiales bacterium]
MLLFTWLVILVMAGDAAQALEYRVKAGYLFNFAKFVEWPAGAFASEDSPFVVAVLGNEEAGAVVASALEGKTINRHPVRVTI